MSFDARAKALLLLGFTGVSIAVGAAYLNPATGYELSIYGETPIYFWVLSSFALLVSILVVFSGTSPGVRGMGAFLGGMTMTVIVSVPIIRGYHYLGTSDSLSHLGTAHDMNDGLLALSENRYPIVHSLGSFLHDVTGLALHHAMLVLVVVFVVCFFVFVPLVVRDLTGDISTTYVGLFSGLLLLPINHLSPSIYIHPTSQAIMYIPAFLFVFLLLYKQRIVRHSAMFLLIASIFPMLHPQQAANLVIFFGVIASMQLGYDVLRGYRLTRLREWVMPEVVFFATVFWIWVRNLDTFWSSLENVYMIPFQDTQAAESTAGRSVSLAEVGGSLPEVFVKLFLVSLVYALLTGLLMIIVTRRYREVESHTAFDPFVPDGGTGNSNGEIDRLLPLYIFSGLVALTMMFLAFLVGGISDQYFRHLGTLMVFGTILGAIAIGRAIRFVSRRRSSPVARRTVVLVLVVCTVLSIPVVFSSPYIYYSSNHVPEMQMSGYETTFEHQGDSAAYVDIRTSTRRYGNAIQGREIPREAYYPDEGSDIPDRFADRSLRTHYNESVYVPVPEADRIRDPVLWKGFRFSHEDFEYLDSEPGINRVQTNGGYDLYHVEPDQQTSGPPEQRS